MTIKEFLNEQDEELMQEDASTVMSVGFLLLLAAVEVVPLVNEKIIKPIKKRIQDSKPIYWISLRPVTKIPDYYYYDCGTEKEAICEYAYSLGIREGAKNTLFATPKARVDEKVYLNKGIRATGKIEIVASGSFKNVCKKYNIEVKDMDKNLLSSRKNALNIATKLVKEKLSNYKYKNKGSWTESKEKQDFFDGYQDSITIFYLSLWDAFPNARQAYGEDPEVEKCTTYLFDMTKEINDSGKLPNGFELDMDGDWDDYDVLLVHNTKLKEETNTNWIAKIDELSIYRE